jgi:uncharacterized protein
LPLILLRDFLPVGSLAQLSVFICASLQSGIKTLPDLIALAERLRRCIRNLGTAIRENKVMGTKRDTRPWAQLADGIVLNVRVTPRNVRDAIEGVEYRPDGQAVLKARVRAAPFEGKANDALRRLIASELGIAPRQVEIAAGATARLKRLRIVGDAGLLDAILGKLIKEWHERKKPLMVR